MEPSDRSNPVSPAGLDALAQQRANQVENGLERTADTSGGNDYQEELLIAAEWRVFLRGVKLLLHLSLMMEAHWRALLGVLSPGVDGYAACMYRCAIKDKLDFGIFGFLFSGLALASLLFVAVAGI